MKLRLVPADHPALHTPALPVEPGDVTRRMVDQLQWVCKREHGEAIAAPQVGLSLQLITRNGVAVLNPEIEARSELEVWGEERCLSLPGKLYRVSRPSWIGSGCFSGSNRTVRG